MTDSYICTCEYESYPEAYSAHMIKAARKAHKCNECFRIIAIGEAYESATGIWDGQFNQYKTCAHCVELRKWIKISVPCFCEGHGDMHENIRGVVDDVRKLVPGFFFEYGRRMVRLKRAGGHV